MTSRSANATIKGYFYQFDHTILQILKASSSEASFVVEGIEDVDIQDGNNTSLVQCKYYEGTTYNHSAVKDSVIQMLRHFHKAGCPALQKLRYCFFGHYLSGQEKLKQPFDLQFLKKHFLAYTDKNKTKQQEHVILKITDEQLVSFQQLLEINISAPSYDTQQSQVMAQIKRQIPNCQDEDVRAFYYPNAINVIQSLAIKSDVNDRMIKKSDFLAKINSKEIVFNQWLKQKFGDEYYAKSIKRKHFKFGSTRVPPASRIFVLDTTEEFDVSKVASLLVTLGRRFSHVEHRSTPQKDRFCPYVILRDLPDDDLVELLNTLSRQGVMLKDGYPFKGSAFNPHHLAAPPTKEAPIQLKFLAKPGQIKPLVKELQGSYVEIFDFFKSKQIDKQFIPSGTPHHAIQVPSAYLIKDAI